MEISEIYREIDWCVQHVDTMVHQGYWNYFKSQVSSRVYNQRTLTGQLGHFEKADVIRYSPNQHRCFAILALHIPWQARERERRPVCLRHVQALQDDLGKCTLGPPRQKPVKLDKKPQVHILGGWFLAYFMANTAPTSHQINTHLPDSGLGSRQPSTRRLRLLWHTTNAR